jgi:hypothetical protein
MNIDPKLYDKPTMDHLARTGEAPARSLVPVAEGALVGADCVRLDDGALNRMKPADELDPQVVGNTLLALSQKCVELEKRLRLIEQGLLPGMGDGAYRTCVWIDGTLAFTVMAHTMEDLIRTTEKLAIEEMAKRGGKYPNKPKPPRPIPNEYGYQKLREELVNSCNAQKQIAQQMAAGGSSY